jgi:quercetin dioxygenase-like cupin family protein
MRTPVALLITLALAAGVITAPTAPLQAAEQHHAAVAVENVEWGPAPPSLPPGAQAAALFGSPREAGPFVLRLKFPAGFVVPPHRHSKDEFVTVISGRFGVESGEKLDTASGTALPAGSFFHLPNGTPHYAWADGETIVQINGVGPFDVTYVNPNDDPRQQ